MIITDTTAIPEAQFSAESYSASESSLGATIAIELSRPSSSPLTAVYTVTGQTAIAGDDYTDSSGTVVFAANTTTTTFNIPITADTMVENDETVALSVSRQMSVIADTALLTITDSSNDPTLTITGPGSSVLETDGTVVMTATLSEATANDVTFTYRTDEGIAKGGADYETVNNQTVTISAGQTTVTFAVVLIDDTLAEREDETFTVTVANVANAALSGGGSVGIVIAADDDPFLAYLPLIKDPRYMGFWLGTGVPPVLHNSMIRPFVKTTPTPIRLQGQMVVGIP